MPNDEPLRPSSQRSIWAEVTTGTPRVCASPTSSFRRVWSPQSECRMTSKTPQYSFGPSAFSSSVWTCVVVEMISSISSVTCVVDW